MDAVVRQVNLLDSGLICTMRIAKKKILVKIVKKHFLVCCCPGFG